jgi:alanine racemase
MVRPGIALYGYGPPDAGITGLKPVMELKTRVTEIKKVQPGTTVSYGRTWRASAETWIATLPVGYADGYPRLLSNRSDVLIGGKRYPVAGTICMDQLMVNLGPVTTVQPGDEAILFGPGCGGPDARELADIIGTISYEITCGIAMRVPRVYVD